MVGSYKAHCCYRTLHTTNMSTLIIILTITTIELIPLNRTVIWINFPHNVLSGRLWGKLEKLIREIDTTVFRTPDTLLIGSFGAALLTIPCVYIYYIIL